MALWCTLIDESVITLWVLSKKRFDGLKYSPFTKTHVPCYVCCSAVLALFRCGFSVLSDFSLFPKFCMVLRFSGQGKGGGQGVGPGHP